MTVCECRAVNTDTLEQFQHHPLMIPLPPAGNFVVLAFSQGVAISVRAYTVPE